MITHLRFNPPTSAEAANGFGYASLSADDANWYDALDANFDFALEVNGFPDKAGV